MEHLSQLDPQSFLKKLKETEESIKILSIEVDDIDRKKSKRVDMFLDDLMRERKLMLNKHIKIEKSLKIIDNII